MGHPGEGYKNQAYRYVVDEVMPDGRVCVRTLGWSSGTKGSLKELDSPRMGWSNPRYQEIPADQRAAELDRPTRWLLSDLTVALPEWTPTLATVRASPKPMQEIVRSQLAAAVADTAMTPSVESPPLANDDEPDFGPILEGEPDFSAVEPSTDALVEEMIAADDDEEDGWSF